VPDAGDVYTEYPDPQREDRAWTEALKTLRSMTKEQLKELGVCFGVSISTVKAWKRGRRPQPRNREMLCVGLKKRF
jgi:DNA-binding transcriptional regulator YiaG